MNGHPDEPRRHPGWPVLLFLVLCVGAVAATILLGVRR